MVWNQSTRPVSGVIITKTWGEQISDAIAQIAKDLYISPLNNGVDDPGNAGLGNLSQPIEKALPICEGIATTAGTTGTLIDLPESIPVDDYRVLLCWQEDPGLGSGDLFVTKTQDDFTIKNSGLTTGKKVAYFVTKGLTV